MRSLAGRDRSANGSDSAVRRSVRRDAWQPAAVVAVATAGVVLAAWDASATAGWLVAGGACWTLAAGRWRTPVCAWVAPVFLLHVTRVEGLWPGMLLVWLALALATGVANRGVLPLPPVVYWLLMGGVYSAVLLPAYALDGVLEPRLPGVASTLVFPLTWVVVEQLATRFNPIGSWGAVAYTQYGHTPLMQVASVTGLGGVTLLIGWFAATANWIWADGLTSATATGGLAYAVVLISVLVAGAIRVAVVRDAPTVRVAGIGEPAGVDGRRLWQLTAERPVSPADAPAVRGLFRQVHAALLAATRREAAAGAKIVVWHELAAPVFADDEAELLAAAGATAQAAGCYLLAGLAVTDRDRPPPRMQNKAVLIGPDGQIVGAYRKRKPAPGGEAHATIVGDGRIPTWATPHGRIAVAICSDLDHPDYIGQVGRSDADILLVPASDWEAIKHLHPQQAALRAIENGVSVIRPDRWGISVAYDPLGRLIAASDHFTTDDRVVIAHVPTRGQPTLYPHWTTAVTWLRAAALAALAALAVAGG
jgi:apolipoprotein N-acyltransferase